MNLPNSTQTTINPPNPDLANNTSLGIQEATDKIKNSNFFTNISKFTNNIGLNSNTNQELQKLSSSEPGVIDNFKNKIISKLENEKIQNIIKASSIEFGKRLGILGNAFIINDNPFADVFFSIKSIFDLVLYQIFNVLLFINIIILNIDETVAIDNFKSNIGKTHILDNFLLSILSSVKNISENVLQSIKNEAFAIIFKHYKTDEKTVELITKLSTEILHNTIHNFFLIFYTSNFNVKTSAKSAELITPKMMGGKLRKLKTKKQKILKRIKTYLANFHNTNHTYKSKTLKRRK